MTKQTASQTLLQFDQDNYLPTFRRYPIVLERGKGALVWDLEGKEYIDALAGIAVNNIGHCHPALVKAVCEQAEKLIHISNFYLSEPQALLSKKLAEISGLDRVFLCNSGAEAVEGAVKVARKFGNGQGKDGTVVSMQNCFHGRTFATIAMGKKAMQAGFGPIPGGFIQIPFNDIQAVHAVLTRYNPAAFIVEPIQGEGGIVEADPDFLVQLRDICSERNIALIFDEIQSGIARTGRWFGKDHYNLQPDIITMAKGLGGGIPIGAFVCSEKISNAIDYGDHGTTFGGNPLASAAALAVLSVIESENLLNMAWEKGSWLKNKISLLDEPSVKQVRGKGLMIGIEFAFETKPLVKEMMERGVLANATAGNVLRLLPPLNIRQEQLEKILLVLKQSLKSIPAVHA